MLCRMNSKAMTINSVLTILTAALAFGRTRGAARNPITTSQRRTITITTRRQGLSWAAGLAP